MGAEMPDNYNDTSQDEIVTIQLPRKDAKILRELINRQKAISLFGRWASSLLLVLGGILTVFTFWTTIRKAFMSWIGG
jgi:cell division protein FtsX